MLVVRDVSVISLPEVVSVLVDWSEPAKLTVPLELVRFTAPLLWRLFVVTWRLLVLTLKSCDPEEVLTVKALLELVVFWKRPWVLTVSLELVASRFRRLEPDALFTWKAMFWLVLVW